MKAFVGTMTAAGHVSFDGPMTITDPLVRWYAYVPQTATDPIVKCRFGTLRDWDAMAGEQAVTPALTGENTSFMPAFRAVVTLRGGKLNLEIGNVVLS